MADIPLVFNITLKNGTKLEQKIAADSEADGKTVPTAEQLCMQMLQQYATVGMLKRDGNKFILVTAGTIETAEVEIPSIVVAGLNDLVKSKLAL